MAQEISDNQGPVREVTRRKRLKEFAGRIGLRVLVGGMHAMPWPLAGRVGRGLGGLLYHILGRYRRVAHKNLALIYGEDKSEAERKDMAKAVFRHFGQTCAEFIKTPQIDRATVDSMVTVVGEENLCQAMAAAKGVLLITGHFGNWEVMARWLTTHGYQLSVVARKANDPEADKLLRATREGNGIHILPRGNAARGVLQGLKKREIIAILPDQNAADVVVPFLGLPTGTADGPGVIHIKTGAPLLFGWCVRTPDNKFHIEFEPPVVIEPTGEKQADVERVMAEINAHLGEQVMRNPTQWLWLHDRWKASPGVFADGAEQARLIRMASNKYRKEMEERSKSGIR